MIDLSWEAARWANAAIAGLVVVLLIAGAFARWSVMPPFFKRVAPWVIGTYVVIAYGSGELAATTADVPPGLRVSFLFFDLIGLAIVLLLSIGHSDYEE